jgi:hypothetical protein
MQTVKRLYLYGVAGISLVLLLWGLTDLVRFVLDGIGGAIGSTPAFGGSFAREELSRAVALVLVAGCIFGVHVVLVRRLLLGDPAHDIEERAATSRSVYFFLVLAGTGVALLWSSFDLAYHLIGSFTLDPGELDPAGRLADVIVLSAGWAGHLLARRHDMRVVPARLAGDWLTRAYLYGGLFITCFIVALEGGDALTTAARAVLDLQPPVFDPVERWPGSITGPLAAVVVAAAGWLTHWYLLERLRRRTDAVGAAHRGATSRVGYFGAVILTGAGAVLILATASLGAAIATVLDTPAVVESRRLVEDIGGPLLALTPFALAWWWHQRRLYHEAAAADGPEAVRSTHRTAHLLVALVGLAGLCAGVAWQLQVVIEAVAGTTEQALLISSGLDGGTSQALALAAVGLVLWAPAWALAQRDRARHAFEAAGATSRRAYLLLVSGLAVVAVMGSLAFVVWQVARVMLESVERDDPSWALAILAVALMVLLYHLWQLRSDARLARVAMPSFGATAGAPSVVETIEILAPPDADLRVLNAAIRSELPDGYEMRIVPRDA